MFFIDPADSATYVKLEGDNQTKAAKGDRLRVKRDTDGALTERIETVILELDSQAANFIDDNNDPDGDPISEPGGLYMKIKPNGFNTQYDPNSFFGGSTVTNSSDVPNSLAVNPANLPNYMPVVNYLCSIPNPNFDPTPGPSLSNLPFLPWTIPSNSRVVFNIKFRRNRRGNGCDQYIYRFQKEFVASEDYASLHAFIIGQNIDFNTGENDPNNGEGPNQNIFDPNICLLYTSPSPRD